MSSRYVVGLVLVLLATPLLIYAKRSLAQPARPVTYCPEGCWCESGTNRLSCPWSSLNNIDSNFLKTIRQFQLDGTSIPTLKKENYISKVLTELEELSLNSCGLETIELGAFSGLTKLTYLSLRSNKLSEIIPGTFEDLCNLEYLDLHNNKIGRLDVDVFSGLVNLKYLFLTHNKLASVHPDVFVSLPALKKLFLLNNPGLQVPNDRHIISSYSLELLDISGCDVSYLSVENFANVSALKWLDLGHNNLRSIDINILIALPELSELRLYENPLQCDCQLQEVWRWCQDHNIQTVFAGKGPRCALPNRRDTLPWEVLEKRRCSQDNITNHIDGQHKRYKRADDEFEHPRDRIMYFKKQILIPIYAVIFVFGIISNTIILIIIIRNKNMHCDTNMYIFNLAIGGIIILLLFFSWELDNGRFFLLSYMNIFFVLATFSSLLSINLSAYSVAMLSIHRYRITVKRSQVRVSSHTTCRAGMAILCKVWTVAALFALPSTFWGIANFVYETLSPTSGYAYLCLLNFFLSCLIPLCVIAFSYIMTARHHEDSSGFISEGSQHPQINICKITAKIVLGLTVVFLTTHVPCHVVVIYRNFNKYDVWSYKIMILREVNTFLFFINSCLNPVVIFCTSPDFIKHLKRYLTCCCKTNSPPTDLELTRRN